MPEVWFDTPGRPGYRSLSQQLRGLDWMIENCAGRTVLDLGCAEGLIAVELARRGAAAVHGVEIVRSHVDVGNRLRGDLPVTFEVGDLNVWKPRRQYDFVVALAVLHKLRDPSESAARFARAARHAIVLRLPPAHAPTIVDRRSGNRPHDIGAVMLAHGFYLLRVDRGHLDEWVGIYVRRAWPVR